MGITETTFTIHEKSAEIACNPEATPILIEIIRRHTKSKFTLVLNAGLDEGSVYDEFQLGDDNLGTILSSYRNELMSRLCSQEGLN